MIGLAFDVGTTTVVGYLWNIEQGRLLGSVSKANPQREINGRNLNDVISRISFAGEKEGNLLILHRLIIGCLNEIIEELCQKYKIEKKAIMKALAVGNTTMSHILVNANPISLATAPFLPRFTGPISKNANILNININPKAEFHILSNIAGHVGSDMLAAILATDIVNSEDNSLIIDIGTNGEILLSKEGKLMCCSTAAGPAFEGANISYGMRASKGAIERIEIDEITGELLLKVIGDVSPIGVCGSGLVDAIAVFLQKKWIDETGKINYKGQKSIAIYESGNEIIEISQKDIREVQYAKGAILTGIEILMKENKITEEQLDKIYLSGAFGNYLSKESAQIIGLIPDCDLNIVEAIGNGAGKGASLALLSEGLFKESNKLANSIEHIELASHHSFQKIFLESMYFK